MRELQRSLSTVALGVVENPFLFGPLLAADANFWKLLGGTEDQVTAKGSSWTPPVFETPKLYSMHDETHQ